ncbi:AAA family ATPase [Hahella sp. CR1]|uniref:ATP-dependent nuclease n=1 Tax=Hahella sp. CR1 TaxID=2992807 RepID=UPI002443736F|nr:AAA family ATPase [Hahella sp. CR1]MDG9671259.1 AAA family ATPase [Hahella sp. CR1]
MRIVVKNYRCYTEEMPLQLNLSRGITSIVGLNNSGKSTIFRFFYEFRSLWARLAGDGLQEVINTNSANISYSLHEPTKVFTDINEKDIQIEISIIDSELFQFFGNDFVSKIHLTLARERINNFNVKLYSSESNSPIDSTKMLYSPIQKALCDKNQNPLHSAEYIINAFGILNRMIYFGANRFASADVGGKHFDLYVGKTFVSRWRDYKLGVDTERKKKISALQKDIRHIFQYEQLEINPSNNDMDMDIIINDAPAKLSEMGDGISQFILTLGTAAISSPSFILIDEPERGLHATMQVDFVTSLTSYAEYGMFLSTHSMGLARAVSDRDILSVHNTPRGATLQHLNSINYLPELLASLNYSAYRDLNFDKVLLVEGTTEVKVFQQFLRLYGLDHKVVIIPLGGDSLVRPGVEHEFEEIKRLAKDNLVAIVDSEQESKTGSPAKKRKEFHSMCGRLNIPCHLTKRRATENYFTQSAISKAFPGYAYSALGEFEKLSNQNSWKKSENWRIAKQMTKSDIDSTDIGIFIRTVFKH